MLFRFLKNNFLLFLFTFVVANVNAKEDLMEFNNLVATYVKTQDSTRKLELAKDLIKSYDKHAVAVGNFATGLVTGRRAGCDAILARYGVQLTSIREFTNTNNNQAELERKEAQERALAEKEKAERDRLAAAQLAAQEQARLEQARLDKLKQDQANQERERLERERLQRLKEQQDKIAAEKAKAEQAQAAAKIDFSRIKEAFEAQIAKLALERQKDQARQKELQDQLKKLESDFLAEKNRLEAEKAKAKADLDKLLKDKSSQDGQSKINFDSQIAKLTQERAKEQAAARDLEAKFLAAKQKLEAEQAKLKADKDAERAKLLADIKKLESEKANLLKTNGSPEAYNLLINAITDSDFKLTNGLINQVKPTVSQKENLTKLSAEMLKKRSSEYGSFFNGNILAGSALVGGAITSHFMKGNVLKASTTANTEDLSKLLDELDPLGNKLKINAAFIQASLTKGCQCAVTLQNGDAVNKTNIALKNYDDKFQQLRDALDALKDKPVSISVDTSRSNTQINILNGVIGVTGLYFIYRGFKQGADKYKQASAINKLVKEFNYAA